MNWHETIEYIRKQQEYKYLVEKAYFEKDLKLNVERFGSSEEFIETVNLIRKYNPKTSRILEIGAGNGIAAINFALLGYNVTVVEPDPSNTIGAGAIRKLVEEYSLFEKIQIIETYAEDMSFPAESFDLVYIRQAMHHAYDLQKFINEAVRVIKKGGYLLTVRDHVIYDDTDKEWFLDAHPLHKFYGGENAYKQEEYLKAMETAGLSIVLHLKHFDNVINYFPLSKSELEFALKSSEEAIRQHLSKKISFLSYIPLARTFYKQLLKFKGVKSFDDERRIPGRMHSYLGRKHG